MSWPAVLARGPSCPQPVMRAKISRGLTAAQSSGPTPSRSQVPGRKQSNSTSALATKPNSACGWLLTSKSTIRLPRCSRSRSSAGIVRPPGRRTRTTSAPKSASTIAACGPGPMPPSSMTRTPANGPVKPCPSSPSGLGRAAPWSPNRSSLDGTFQHEAGQGNYGSTLISNLTSCLVTVGRPTCTCRPGTSAGRS